MGSAHVGQTINCAMNIVLPSNVRVPYSIKPSPATAQTNKIDNFFFRFIYFVLNDSMRISLHCVNLFSAIT